MSFSFASKISRMILSPEGDDDDNSETLTPESPLFSASSSLFSSLANSTIVSPQDDQNDSDSPQPSPPGTTRPSFSPCPSPLSPISIPRPPILTSTPMSMQPDTQQLALRMVDLRTVDEVDAIALQRENIRLRRENESLQSEGTALRLQHEDDVREIGRLRLLHSPSLPQQQQPPSATDEYLPFMTKSKKKRLKKKARIERALLTAADTTRPPGCTSLPLPRPPPPPQAQASLPTLFVFHDSNLKGTTAADLNKAISGINNNNNNNNNRISNFNISLHETYTLSQTLDKIRQTTFNRNDTVIIGTLTNDARQTNKRQRRTPDQTKQIQIQIIQHLIKHIPNKNITLLEAPPLLDSTSSDIYPYNLNSYSLSRQFGCGFSRILIGESHLWSDGFHILHKHRHLLLKSVAAAAARINVHEHHKLLHPPFGAFGPWAAPKGQGIIPFSKMALKQPLNFRRASPIQPLMGINIHRY